MYNTLNSVSVRLFQIPTFQAQQDLLHDAQQLNLVNISDTVCHACILHFVEILSLKIRTLAECATTVCCVSPTK